jgi:hypothetical protein
MEDIDQHRKILSEYVDIIHDHSKHPDIDEKKVLRSLEFLDKYNVTESILKVASHCLLLR